MAEDTGGTMAKATPRHKPDEPPAEIPRAYGMRGIGGLVARVSKPAFRRRTPGAAQLIADWAMVVGPALAPRTTPLRLSAGTLTIACEGPVAMELQQLAPQLMARINTHLGGASVQRLRFVQAISPTLPSGPPPEVRPRAAPVAIPGLPPGPLHDALSRLGAAVKASRG